MNKLIEIGDGNSLNVIMDRLVTENDSFSLPVRGMLNLITKSKLIPGKVYVDGAVSNNVNCFECIATVHDSTLYCPYDDDFACVYARKTENFESFMKNLAEIRSWRRKNVVLFYLDKKLTQTVERCLSDISLCTIHGPTNLFLAVNERTIDELKNRLNQRLAEMPDNFVLEKIRSKDADVMADTWTYPVPNKRAMFRWMAINLPSIAIRDTLTDRLVAWILTYTCGAGAAHFVHRNYRGHGFGVILSLASAIGFWENFHFPRYGGYVEGNVAAEKTMQSSFPDFKTLGATNWIYLKPKCATAKL